jgi:ATP-dependent DNA helicase DinG
MIEAVGQAFSRDQVLLVEAGTGTGKSLAYGLPAALWARASGQPVVISTGTINLQEQLVGKDLPLVSRALKHALGDELSFALVKGRANYL